MVSKLIRYIASQNNLTFFPILFLYFIITCFFISSFSQLGWAQNDSASQDEIEDKPNTINIPELSLGQDIIPRIENLKPLITLKFLTLDDHLHPWKKYIGDFRQGHHFHLLTGVLNRNFYVDKFANANYLRGSAQNVLAKFAYDFYLPLYKGLGYALGTEAGGSYAFDRSDSVSFDRMSIEYPGFRGTLAYNLNPLFRFGFLAGVFVERTLNFKANAKELEEEQVAPISINFRVIDRGFFVDYFYTLNWGLRLEYHVRHAVYRPPSGTSGKALDAQIYTNDEIYSLGLLLHIF